MNENSSIQTIPKQNTLQDILINDVRRKISEAVRGKVILQSQGKEFFTWHGKDFFT